MDDFDRWILFCQRIGARGNFSQVYEELVRMHTEPQRFYHTWEGHVMHCLREFDDARHLSLHPDELEMGIRIHDIFYDIWRKDNELRSAEYGTELCKRMGLSPDFGQRVFDRVFPTDHKLPVLGIDPMLVVDIDLSIFGQPPDVFDAYEVNVTKEYQPWIDQNSMKEFKVGRAGVLIHFLTRKIKGKERIYYTDFFYDKYEHRARENLERSLERLRD
jgi:predicted metal-dependent HD superfamily phosphohydrolase